MFETPQNFIFFFFFIYIWECKILYSKVPKFLFVTLWKISYLKTRKILSSLRIKGISVLLIADRTELESFGIWQRRVSVSTSS